jgi:hypothetical protein
MFEKITSVKYTHDIGGKYNDCEGVNFYHLVFYGKKWLSYSVLIRSIVAKKIG